MKSLIFGLIILIPSLASAGLVGKDVNFQCPECGPPYDETFTAVAGGSELTPFGQFEVNVEDDFLRVGWLISSSSIINPGHFVFAWDAADFSIVDATLDALSTLAYSFSFTDSSVSIDFSGVPVTRGDFVQVNLTSTSVPVPEPSSMALLALGLIGLGMSRKKKV